MLRKAVIVAGGAGTRLGVERGLPKVLVEVGGEPLLARHLRLFERHGVGEVVIVGGHLAERIESWLAQHGPTWPRCTLVRETRPLGTAGGLSSAMSRFQEAFFVLYGDVLAEVDLRRLAGFHVANGAVATLVAHPNSHPYDSDLIDAPDDVHVRRLLPAASRTDEAQANLVSAGMYVLGPGVLQHIAPDTPQDFIRDVFPALLAAGKRVVAYRTPEYLKDMGTPERLDAVREDVAVGRPEACAWGVPRPTVFLDRDGTLNQLRGEIVSPASLELIPGAARAVRTLNAAGVLVILVTNQPMIAKGQLTLDALSRIHARLETLLGREGAYLDAIRFCPHHPQRGFPGEVIDLKFVCRCRKPEPGMLISAMRELPVDAERSALIGDSWRDALAARSVGVFSIGVRKGEGFYGPNGPVAPYEMADDLGLAVDLFLRRIHTDAPARQRTFVGGSRS